MQAWLSRSFAFLAVVSSATAGESLFASSRTGNDSGPEGVHYELGTVFRAQVPGRVTHIRAYALASESGAHTARLWRNDGLLVGGPWSWTYAGNTGWISLDVPDVVLTPQVDYTVVVSTGDGGRNYPFRSQDLAAAGSNGLNLTHPAAAGKFSVTNGAYPNQSFNAANYYRDVIFEPDPTEPPADAPVRINEFLAENASGLDDEDGSSEDWLELYNPRGAAVDLTGYSISDGSATWVLPSGLLGPQSFRLIFLSGKNRQGMVWHANFKLAGAGEYLVLKDATGAVVSSFSPQYPAQKKNVSYGRGSGGQFGYFILPTPGFANGPAALGFVADTSFSVRRGFYVSTQSVAITTATAGAEIRYTLDGSEPTASSLLYSAPLSIGQTTTLRVRGFKSGFLPTNTDTQTYLFLSDVLQQTQANTVAAGWPTGPVNTQQLRYGNDSPTAAQYTVAQKEAALREIPSFSIVTAQENLTGAAAGVYVNGTTEGLEQPVSVEYLFPNALGGFQIDAGLRMRGGQSRQGHFPKHSFNLFFRSLYGAGKLEYPLFGTEGVRRFDTLSLRCEHGYAYADPHPASLRSQFTAVRDVFCRELWSKAGFASTRSNYAHLYLNGRYWGLYQTQERAQEDFGASYFGGKPEEYDAVAATGLPQLRMEATSGDLTAWNQLWTGARAVATAPTNANYFALLGKNPDGSSQPSLPALLNPQALAAYMLLHYYTGHADEPLSTSFNWEKPNNFRALRRRSSTEPWHFLVHDGESSMLAAEWTDNRANVANLTSSLRSDFPHSNPEWMHEDLLANSEYRLAFADEAHRLLTDGGPFTAANALALWDRLASQISQAVIGESMRWAQLPTENQAQWLAEIQRVRANFFPNRSAAVLQQLRQTTHRGFAQFPSVDAPLFAPAGGNVAPGSSIALSAAAGGQVYFSTNGLDPRAIGGAVQGTLYASPIAVSGPTRVLARFRSTAGEWSALAQAWFTTDAPASAANLELSKIHYHPTAPSAAEQALGFSEKSDFEYLELRNTSQSAIDLRGVQISGGVTFTFADGSLPPGARVVVVENLAAFQARYGSTPAVAGVFAGNLSDGGEALRVSAAGGQDIALVNYDDVSPWPVLPDGTGAALVYDAMSQAWRSSHVAGGKPGESDAFTLAAWQAIHFSAAELAEPSLEASLWGAVADPDRDGLSNLAEYALARLPKLADAADFLLESGEASYVVRRGAVAANVVAEVSADLLNWLPLPVTSREELPDYEALLQVTVPPTHDARCFLHLRISLP
jgi:hypothetical protein